MPRLQLVVVGMKRSSGSEEIPWLEWKGRVRPAEMADIYSSVDALLFPTRYEACSMTVLEAMANGVAVIGSPVVAWQVGDGGRIVNSWNPAEYAVEVNRLLGSQIELSDLSRRAAQRALAFSWEGAALQYIQLLETSGLF
jgi:glycosyltransferase involved in cell wall biosynthesis